MWPNSPSVNADDHITIMNGNVAVDTLSATAVLHQFGWRHGVVDSIRGFGSLDPGSNPGASAKLRQMGHGVMESMLGCGPLDLGSTPSAPAIHEHGGAKTQHRKMKT